MQGLESLGFRVWRDAWGVGALLFKAYGVGLGFIGFGTLGIQVQVAIAA